MHAHFVLTTLALLSLNLLQDQAIAQVTPTMQNHTPNSYTDYFHQQVGSYQSAINPRRYTVDRYFYRNQALSPYLNLTRRTGPTVNNYYRYVTPELNRRAATRIPGIRPIHLESTAGSAWQGAQRTPYIRYYGR